MTEWVRLALGIVILLAVTLSVLSWAAINQRRAVLLASVRAVVQLAFVAAVLRGVFQAPLTVIAVLAVMFSVADLDSGSAPEAAARRPRQRSSLPAPPAVDSPSP